MDPVRSWVRNVGVVDANVAAQRYSRKTKTEQNKPKNTTADLLTPASLCSSAHSCGNVPGFIFQKLKMCEYLRREQKTAASYLLQKMTGDTF